jgi:benzaldehyde dehydrogenase (NAD)
MTGTAAALLGENWFGAIYGAGGWQPGRGGTLPVVEPATGDTLGEAGCAGVEDVREAAEAAAEAQAAWGETDLERRAEVMRAAATILTEHLDEAATWIVRESGSTRPKADVELHVSVNELWQAAAMPMQPVGELLPSVDTQRMSIAMRVPIGVVGVIAPWNFPVILAMRTVAPALAVGNAVVLKPDPNTPVCGGVLLARVFEEAGLPPGVFQMLPGGPEIGAALVEDPNVRLISFTGSTAVGRKVGEVAARHLKRVALELGGNNPLVILEDADIEAASSSGAFGSFLHQGQICMGTGRHIVQERIADDYVEALVRRADALHVGDPNTEQVHLGPLIDERHVERVDGIVQDAVAAGAQLATGGRDHDNFYRPTVLADVTTSMRAWGEEIFGPVAPVLTFGDEEEAIVLANATELGLAAGVHTGSVGRGMRIASRLRAGMVHVNDQTVNDEAHTPFGGFGASGNGARFGGTASWEQLTEWRWLTIRDQPIPYPF